MTCRLINEVINKRKRKPFLPSSFPTEGRTVTNPKEIADSFCKYFSNFGPNLAKALPAINYSFRLFLSDFYYTPITLRPTDVNEFEDICSKFSSGKAPIYDDIPMHVIKNSFHLVSAPLMSIVNLSLQKVIFPDKMKIAKVIPEYKAEDPSRFVNYRPFSLEPAFSKFLE